MAQNCFVNQNSVKMRIVLQNVTLALNQNANVGRGILIEAALTLTSKFKLSSHVKENTGKL